MDLHNKYPDCVCCNFGIRITFNVKHEINSFQKWIHSYIRMIYKPSYILVPVGVSGVLYPPESINKEVFNKEVFMKICIYADDMWLKVMGMLNKTRIMQTNCFPRHFFTIKNTQNERLSETNIFKKQNDVQFQALLERYKKDLRKILDELPYASS